MRSPGLIAAAAAQFGSQCVVLAIDARRNAAGGYSVVINGGRIDTGLDAVEWRDEGVRLGAGEILLTSMDADGTRDGFDIDMLNAVAREVGVPVIASGGCGSLAHFAEVFEKTPASAALAASPVPLRGTDGRPGERLPARARDTRSLGKETAYGSGPAVCKKGS